MSRLVENRSRLGIPTLDEMKKSVANDKSSMLVQVIFYHYMDDVVVF